MLVINDKQERALPIKIWSDEQEIALQSGAIDQARNLARHPLVEKWVGLMPDFHQGYGMPIGGVVVMKDGVIPYCVGNDIGCGVLATRLALGADEVTLEQLQQWREAVHQRVPVGNAQHKDAQSLITLPQPPFFAGVKGLTAVAEELNRNGRYQLGTLGSGNHFVELDRGEDGYVWLLVHSGSRSIGGAVCARYFAAAKKLMETFKIRLPDPQLAYIPRDIPLYDQYMAEMAWAMAYAEANRARMTQCAVGALQDVTDDCCVVDEQFDCVHNYAALENHYQQNYLVIRKGAVRARAGEKVVIPGSMGTASYIGEGLGCAEAFETCSHGAGRRYSRTKANAAVTHDEAVASMAHVVYGVRQGDYDELPHAYKGIDEVMAQQADLVKPVQRLTPLAVVKG
jgi:tRNA-splicing ligase RtcB